MKTWEILLGIVIALVALAFMCGYRVGYVDSFNKRFDALNCSYALNLHKSPNEPLPAYAVNLTEVWANGAK